MYVRLTKTNVLFGISTLCVLTIIGYPIVSGESSSIVPHWIKNNAKWWADGSISDSEFLTGIKYLIDKKIIMIDSDTKIPSVQIITEKAKYRVGEPVLITVKNIGTDQVRFPGNPPFGIKNSKSESICCSGTEGLVTLLPNKELTHVWSQLNFITSKQTETGKYKIYVIFRSENYPENFYEVSRWIEITN